MMIQENVLLALALTVFAGLSTGVGSGIAFFARHTSKRFLSFSLGLSAGVMIYVSFMEILYHARIDIATIVGARQGDIITAIAFFGGMFIAAMIDKIVPSVENPHELMSIEDINNHRFSRRKTSLRDCTERPCRRVSERHMVRRHMSRMGLMTALAVGIHNFPEGIATFMATVQDPKVGVAIAFAIAIHNIPEGIAVSVPIYFATKSRKKAFWYSFLSGLSEPVGAVLAYFVLMPFMSTMLLSCVFAATAGIMIYISLDELLPAAQRYGEHHISIYGLVTGMVIMAISLILLL